MKNRGKETLYGGEKKNEENKKKEKDKGYPPLSACHREEEEMAELERAVRQRNNAKRARRMGTRGRREKLVVV